MLKADNLSCLRNQKPVFKQLAFIIRPGETLLLTGKNGSGKSSLLRIIAGLATPFSGKIFWKEKNISSFSSYKNQLHYLGHQNGLQPGLSIQENLMLYAHLMQEKPVTEINKQIEQALALYQINVSPKKLVSELSAGQARKVALCKLYLIKKPFWILDEPLTALDTDTQTVFIHQLNNHLAQDGLALISSHHVFDSDKPFIKKLHLEAAC